MRKYRKLQKIILMAITAFCLLFLPDAFGVRASAASTERPERDKTVICIDAGHGGETDGATYTYDGITVYEKDLNLQIASRIELELNKYQDVVVVMTRRDDRTVELKERAEMAYAHDSDCLVSIHNNAAANPAWNPKGCMVLATCSRYQAVGAKIPNIYDFSGEMSSLIIRNLQALGLTLGNELGAESNAGLVRRPYSPDGGAKSTSYYKDGSVSDYYALIRYGVEKGIPSIIVEHAYLSNEEDYRDYLASADALDKLAIADAQAIAEALQLQLK